MPATDHEARTLIEALQATVYGGVSGVTPAKVGSTFYTNNPPLAPGTVNASGDVAIRSLTLLPNSPYSASLPGNAAVATPGGAMTGVVLDYGGAVFHVKAFGCKGDGVTDDTANLALAETKAIAAAPAMLDYGMGVYVVSAPQNWGVGVSRRGSGRGAAVLKSTVTFGTTGANRGILQFSGATVFANISCEKLGFDLSATVDAGVGKFNALKSLGGPLQHVKFSDLRFDCPVNHGAILFDSVGQGVGSYDLLFRDIWVRNGGTAIGVYVNGQQAGALTSGIKIDGCYNLIDAVNVNDDRIVVSAHNGGSGTSELRDVEISGIFVSTVTGATGACNAVKLDTGVNGFIHGVSIHDVFHFGLATGFTIERPVSGLLGAGGTMQDISVDTVFGYHTQGVTVRTTKNGHNPFISIRNVKLLDCWDTVAGIELYCSTGGGNDAMVCIEKFSLDMTAAPVGNLPIGVMLTGGGAAQGYAGVNVIRDGAVNGGAIGVCNQRLESGALSALGWTNCRVEDVAVNGVTVLTVDLQTNTGKIRDCPGTNPKGSVAPPAFPATTVAQANTSNYDITAFIANGAGAITQIAIGGTNTNMQIAANGWGAIPVPAGQTIAFTYAAGAPAWTWMAA